MKKRYKIFKFPLSSGWLVFALILLSATIGWSQTTRTWTGAVSSEWGEAGNWSPSGEPQPGDNIIINSGTNQPEFEEFIGINNFTINSGTLDLMSFTMVIAGEARFGGGSIINGDIVCNGSLSVFRGTSFSAGITVSSGNVNLAGSVFNNPITVTKTGATNVISRGGNTFKANVTIANSGSGNLTLADTLSDTFEAQLTISNTGSGIIFMSHNSSGNSFQGNIIVNSTGSSLGIRFGQNGGTSTLTSGNTISIGGSGFSSGDLRLRNFTQSGSTAQTLTTFSGTTGCHIETGCQFNGALTITAPQLFVSNSTFNAACEFSKTGANNNQSLGGNTFNSTVLFANSGSGDITLGTSSADIFNNVVTFTATGSGGILPANIASGNQFNHDIIVNCNSASSRGVRFGQNGGSSTLASGRTIQIGSLGFDGGSLRLRNFTQTGSTAQSLVQTSGTSLLMIESGCTFNGNVTFSFPQLQVAGSTFNGTASLTKNGGGNNSSSGGNTFNGATTITNSGTGNLTMATTNGDVFNGVLTLVNSGSSAINMAHTSTGNQFNQNIVVNATSGNGIRFGQNSGSSTLASSRTITVGGSGFSAGDLLFRNFYQDGGNAQSLTLTGSAGLVFESGTVWTGNFTGTAPKLLLNGATFEGTATLTKTGSSSDSGLGGNTFEGTTVINNSGSGDLTMALVFNDIFNAQLTVNNTGSDVINLAYGAEDTEFNHNIIMNSTGSSGGIRFGQGDGTCMLASGRTITIGGSGFTSGDLRLAHFEQLGSTAQNLTSFGSSVEVYLESGSVFNGALTLTAPEIYLDGATFNNSTTITKNGSGLNLSAGGNVFNGTTTISNTGTGSFLLAGANSDNFNGAVTFTQTNSNTLFPAYSVNCNFTNNISTSGTLHKITFGDNGGRVTFSGTSLQAINGSSSASPEFKNITLNKSSNTVNVNVPILVTDEVNFTSGRMRTTSTNPITFADNATAVNMSNNSYVNGPVIKEGDDAFTFPLGKGSVYRPISISAPSTTAARFVAEYFLDDSNILYPHSSKDASIHHLSACEYWILDRLASSAAVSVTLTWNTVSCGVTSLGDLLVARWDGSQWRDHGNGGTTGNTTAGSITSSGPISSFSPFTLSSSNEENPLPVELLNFEAKVVDQHVELEWVTLSEINNDYFTIERSYDAVNFEAVSVVSGAGNSNIRLTYNARDYDPFPGISYYRLKQTDFNGEYSYSGIEAVVFNKGAVVDMVLSPNPVVNDVTVQLSGGVFRKPLVVVRDVRGTKVFEETFDLKRSDEKILIDMSLFNSGLYLISASEGNQKVTRRVIKK
ncbi:MAG: T9SS type A sorting domain-containing protein [Flavobacteriales bacterium]